MNTKENNNTGPDQPEAKGASKSAQSKANTHLPGPKGGVNQQMYRGKK
jgi:hypothetical protein